MPRKSKTSTTAIVLAAGQGTKCWPYGATQNKAILPVAAQPLILRTVHSLKAAGLRRIVVVTGYRGEQVRAALRCESGIEFVVQTGPPGTATALLNALSACRLTGTEPVLLLYGDVLYSQADLEKLLQTPAGDAALLVPVLPGRMRDWICAKAEGDQLRDLIGHPREGATHRFAGAFRLQAQPLLPYLHAAPGRMQSIEVGQMPPDEAHLEDALWMALQDGREIRAVEATTECIDIDKPWHLLQANAVCAQQLCADLQKNRLGRGAKISPAAHVQGTVRLGDHSEIGPGCFIKGNLIAGDHTHIFDGAIVEGDCVIGSNTTIRRYCQVERRSCIGSHCFIGHGAEFGGVMMDRSYAYHYGEYWGVLGTACDLGAATVCGNLRFDDRATEHRVQGRREIPDFGANAAYLGDYVRTGVNAIIMPGVKVGPYAVLGAGAIIREDVAANTLVYVEQTLQQRRWGPEKYGW